ncbi:uncharacterized protein LOC111708181 isoform X3 [Eurytemora carolleeae]|uniref:uncharacterized protein LOC111708181 isoform X2 n=1 Tax=Eurytemora carolleeae TaxID=1294199 RepID=UPI000C77D846|nr:uncharacterized protein LOC111708181 isoform X2 [Eurytemora carolleeae]XP_023337266.1 uncharacterized protein LOC111708181 isoform X3 [Eurytemora carolleeae]|eukprot:XP_023337258.1 uncharacterized protein LOC111708181 isoform X2 [Eurytemora affinis]
MEICINDIYQSSVLNKICSKTVIFFFILSLMIPGTGSDIAQCGDKDFSCFSDNWEYLECVFNSTHPSQLFINHINMELQDGVYRTQKYDSFFHCEPELSFRISEEQCSDYYGYIDGFSLVRPGQMVLEEKDTGERVLNLVVGRSKQILCFKPICLLYNIHVHSKRAHVQLNILSNQTAFSDTLIVPDLTPYTEYTIGIRSKPCLATGERFWSPWLNFTVSTASSVPDVPDVSRNAYLTREASENITIVTLYWRKLEERFQNGENFTYSVLFRGQKYLTKQATFEAQLKPGENATFLISSENDKGSSNEFREIFVDGSKVGEGGRSVLVQEDNIPVLYFKPIRYEDSITLFWCIHQHCQSGVDWMSIERSPVQLQQGTGPVFINWNMDSGLTHLSCSLNSVELKAGGLYNTFMYLRNGTVHVQTLFQGCTLNNSGDFMINRTLLTFCQSSGCENPREILANGSNLIISDLESSTCYIMRSLVTLISGFTMETRNSTYCTLPDLPPTVKAAFIQNSILRIELKIDKSLQVSNQTYCRFILSKYSFNSSCTQIIERNISNILNPGCSRLEVSQCTEWACTDLSPAFHVSTVPTDVQLDAVHISEENKIDLLYGSSSAEGCEARVYDNILRDYARFDLDPPSCEDDISNCCSLSNMKSKSELVLGTGELGECSHLNVSMRCWNLIIFDGRLRHLYSGWSESMDVKSTCIKSSGTGEIVGIGIGISIATVLGSAVLLLLAVQVYRFKQKISAISGIEPGHGIPLDITEANHINPFSDLPPAYQESSFLSDLSLPPYNSFTVQNNLNQNNTRNGYEYQMLSLH